MSALGWLNHIDRLYKCIFQTVATGLFAYAVNGVVNGNFAIRYDAYLVAKGRHFLHDVA